MRLALFLSLTSLICNAQSISFGVIGGGRPTGSVDAPAIDESKRYSVGPMLDIGLPLGFGIEVDALYSRDGYGAGNVTPLAATSLRQRDNTWEFPMLLKHTLPFPIVKPFVEIGYAPRVMSGTLNISGTFLSNPNGGMTAFSQNSDANFTTQGIVVGGGVRVGAGKLRLSPQVRYTYWTGSAFRINLADGPNIGATQNQVDVLIGIGWKVH
jgi:hypothetical protein